MKTTIDTQPKMISLSKRLYRYLTKGGRRILIPIGRDPSYGIRNMVRLVACGFFALVLLVSLTAPVMADEETDPTVAIVPGEGPVGTEVFVQITNFGAKKGVIVTLGGKTNIVDSVITDADGSAVASFTIEPYPAGWCEVWADDGDNEAWVIFTVQPRIELSQTSGYIGDEIKIEGDGFDDKKKVTVYFDDEELVSDESNSSGSLTNLKFTVPESGRGEHIVRAEDTEENFREVTFTTRQTMSIDPVSGIVGDKVKVTGNGFESDGDIIVYFGDNDVIGVPIDSKGSFSTSFDVPGASEGVHTVKADDGENRYYVEFTVGAALKLTPKKGAIGTDVALEGTGFKADSVLTITYDNAKIDSTTTNENGKFTFRFKIPTSKHGAHTITIDDGSNLHEAKFQVEKEAPLAPGLVLPPTDGRFEKTIYFDWADVIDPSGVTYTIEIAADVSFSEILLSEANLTSSEYAMPEDQKILPHRKEAYFWRIRAIDGASNEGNWSEERSFFLGPNMASIMSNMPSWTKYVLIGLGLILFAFLFFWIGHIRTRGRSYEDDLEYDYDENYDSSYSEYEDDSTNGAYSSYGDDSGLNGESAV